MVPVYKKGTNDALLISIFIKCKSCRSFFFFTRWVVLTSRYPTRDLMLALEKQYKDSICFCVVALTPNETAPELPETISGQVVYLSAGEQSKLPYAITRYLPWGHISRKNIGYGSFLLLLKPFSMYIGLMPNLIVSIHCLVSTAICMRLTTEQNGFMMPRAVRHSCTRFGMQNLLKGMSLRLIRSIMFLTLFLCWGKGKHGLVAFHMRRYEMIGPGGWTVEAMGVTRGPSC